jgi:hypothetical protein
MRYAGHLADMDTWLDFADKEGICGARPSYRVKKCPEACQLFGIITKGPLVDFIESPSRLTESHALSGV